MIKNKIISNASPIIALSAIGKISLLNNLYSEIFVPSAVYKEVVTDAWIDKTGCVELEQALKEKRIILYHVQNTSLVTKMEGKLHQGELEVIVGAKELDLNIVLIDDGDARKMAKTLSLSPLGTVGLLGYAKQRGQIDEVKRYLDILKDRGFRFSRKLYQEALSDAGEKV
jgi:predicted nucleic acid-binding protein